MKIKSGDTLSQIAKDKGMTLKALLAANPSIKNANQIRVGQNITIPPKAMIGKGEVSGNPYKGMTRTQMNMMAKDTAENRKRLKEGKPKSKKFNTGDAMTSANLAKAKSGSMGTSAVETPESNKRRQILSPAAQAVKAKKQKEEAQKKKLLKRAKAGRGF